MALPFFELLFYTTCMTRPDPDRLRYAQIAGAAARHALGWRLTADEEATAVTELAEAAAGRADLLAERAGTALGFGEGRPDAARYRQIAELCIAAGADQTLIGRWIKVGRERAAAAAAIPYTGLPPGGLTDPDARPGGGARAPCALRNSAPGRRNQALRATRHSVATAGQYRVFGGRPKIGHGVSSPRGGPAGTACSYTAEQSRAGNGPRVRAA